MYAPSVSGSCRRRQLIEASEEQPLLVSRALAGGKDNQRAVRRDHRPAREPQVGRRRQREARQLACRENR